MPVTRQQAETAVTEIVGYCKTLPGVYQDCKNTVERDMPQIIKQFVDDAQKLIKEQNKLYQELVTEGQKMAVNCEGANINNVTECVGGLCKYIQQGQQTQEKLKEKLLDRLEDLRKKLGGEVNKLRGNCEQALNDLTDNKVKELGIKIENREVVLGELFDCCCAHCHGASHYNFMASFMEQNDTKLVNEIVKQLSEQKLLQN